MIDMRPNELRIHVARRRHIIRVERSAVRPDGWNLHPVLWLLACEPVRFSCRGCPTTAPPYHADAWLWCCGPTFICRSVPRIPTTWPHSTTQHTTLRYIACNGIPSRPGAPPCYDWWPAAPWLQRLY